MDCNEALAKLELSRSEACADGDPEWVAASAHLAECARCRTVVTHREEMDRAIATVCRDVPIPAGLEDRLLEAVGAELGPKPVPPRDNSASQKRRRSVGRVAAAAGLLCLAAVGLFMFANARISLDHVTQAAVRRLDAQTAGPLFTGDYDPQRFVLHELPNLPPSMRMDAFRDLLPQRPELAIAVSQFEFRSGGGGLVRGVLIVAPEGRISGGPAAGSISAATPVYHSGISSVAWNNGGYVYVCMVHGGDGPLRELQRQVREQTT